MHESVLSPVTRISGLLSIDVTIEGRTIVDARCRGEQFRGYEEILRGRQADDAVYLSQRICGICSMAHGYTAALALEQAFGDSPTPEARRLRQAMLGAEFLQNHLRHFYLLALPDYVHCPEGPYSGGEGDCRFTPDQTKELVAHYFGALVASRQAHEMLAVFGGKIPHQHGLVRGGVTVKPSADRQMQFLALLGEVKTFIDGCLVPDAALLAGVYPDYFTVGRRPAAFLSYGLFDPALGGHFPPGVIPGTPGARPDPAKISEDLDYAWFRRLDGRIVPDAAKEPGYTWVLAARYDGLPLEGGPVARRVMAGLRSPDPAGTMDRLLARAQEAALIAGWIRAWVEGLPPDAVYLDQAEGPPAASGLGMHDAPRGALLHGIELEGQVIKDYRIITPTTWNFSPRDRLGQYGPAEQALLGTEVQDPAHPVEIGRHREIFRPLSHLRHAPRDPKACRKSKVTKS